MSVSSLSSKASSAKRYILAGVLMVIPIWITWLTVQFVLKLLIEAGAPIVTLVARALRPLLPGLSELLMESWLRAVIAVVVVVVALYVLGWLTTKVTGRLLIKQFEDLIERIPLVQSIYGGFKQLIMSLQSKPDGVERVVLINHLSPQMKAVGLVTATLLDQDTGRDLLAVYVPTAPNPTSGYLEIVPREEVVSTGWTVREAMSFITSGGAVAPSRMINYEKSAYTPKEPAD